MPPAVNPAYNVTYITGNTPATHRASLDASPGGPLATAPHHWVPKSLPKIFYEPRADNTYHVSSTLLEYCCAPFFEIDAELADRDLAWHITPQHWTVVGAALGAAGMPDDAVDDPATLRERVEKFAPMVPAPQRKLGLAHVVVEDAMATGTYWDLITPNRMQSGNPSGESPWTSTWRTRQLIPGFWTVAGYSTDPFDTCVKLLVPPDIPADATQSLQLTAVLSFVRKIWAEEPPEVVGYIPPEMDV